MTFNVFIWVLGAAILHAIWNALLKGGHDKLLSMAAIVVGHVPFAVFTLIFVPLPSPQSIPYLVTSMFLHAGYQLFLLKSYKIGDLTHVYPIARGSAPLMVTLFSILILDIQLSLLQLLSILTIATGIISLALVRRDSGNRNFAATKLALTTGLFIASYSMVDGLGARASENSWGFYCVLTLGNAAIAIIFLIITSPKTLLNLYRKGFSMLVIGGGASFLSYGIVTWAFTQSPIPLVTALRETSIVFALLIGIIFLKERINLVKICSTFLTLLGTILLRFAKGG